MTDNILIHIPHSSKYIPGKYKSLFYLSSEQLRVELLKMTDSYTDELFDVYNCKSLIFPISRLICDVERFREEKKRSHDKTRYVDLL